MWAPAIVRSGLRASSERCESCAGIMELSISMIEARRRQQAAAGAQSAVAQRRSAQADSSPSQLPSVRPHMPFPIHGSPYPLSLANTLTSTLTTLAMWPNAHAVPGGPACAVIATWSCRVV